VVFINGQEYWRPEQTRKRGHLPGEGVAPYLKETDYSTRIRPGTIIVWSDRKAYQVVEITERPVDLWPEHFRKEWKGTSNGGPSTSPRAGT